MKLYELTADFATVYDADEFETETIGIFDTFGNALLIAHDVFGLVEWTELTEDECCNISDEFQVRSRTAKNIYILEYELNEVDSIYLE